MKEDRILKKRGYGAKRRLIIWWSSYLAVLAVPLLFWLITFGRNMSNMNESIHRIQITTLEQFSQRLEHVLQDATNLASDLVLSENIQAYSISGENDLTPSQKLGLLELQSSLSKYLATNSSIDSVSVYFWSMGAILTSSKMYRGKHFDLFFRDTGYPEALFMQFLRAGGEVRYSLYGELDGGSLIYFRSLTGGSGENEIVAAIQISGLSDDMGGFLSSDRSALYLCGDSGYIAAGDTDGVSSADILAALRTENDIDNIKEYEDIAYTSIGGEKYVLLQTGLSTLPLRVVLVVPRAVYFTEIYNMIYLLILLLLITLMAGGYLAYKLSRHNYSPVERLYELMSNTAQAASGEGDELKSLEQGIEQILRENESSHSTLSEKEEQLSIFTLKEQLRGHSGEGGLPENVGEHYAVILMKITEYGDQFTSLPAKQVEELSLLVISNIVGELLEEISPCVTLEIDGYVASLVSVPMECGVSFEKGLPPERLDRRLPEAKKAVEQGKDFIAANFGIRFFSAESGIFHGGGSLYAAYAEAVEAMRYMLFMGTEQSPAVESSREVDASEQRRITNMLMAGDGDGALARLRELAEAAFGFDAPVQELRNRFYSIKLMLDECLRHVGGTAYGEIAGRVRDCRTVKELMGLFDEIEAAENSEKLSDDSRISDILGFMGENFTNPDVNVNYIADRFAMDRFYLTKMIKKHTGLSPIEYLSKLRFEKAKELLTDTDMNLSEIAEKSGFTGTPALNRAFTKMEGVTAGRYRGILNTM